MTKARTNSRDCGGVQIITFIFVATMLAITAVQAWTTYNMVTLRAEMHQEVQTLVDR